MQELESCSDKQTRTLVKSVLHTNLKLGGVSKFNGGKNKMKVTKAMINKAEAQHFRTESYTSLQRLHALEAAYYSQRGNLKEGRYFAAVAPKAMLTKYIGKRKATALKKKVQVKRRVTRRRRR